MLSKHSQLTILQPRRARGIRERILVYGHALKNALIPVITLIGLQIAILLAGAVLTETVFSWPGMGSYLVERISTAGLHGRAECDHRVCPAGGIDQPGGGCHLQPG